jgi:Polyketide cyclase / dehydrase and lipid transport
VFNYLAILLLSVKKSTAEPTWELMPAGPFRAAKPPEATAPAGLPEDLRSSLLGLLSAIAIGISMIGLSVFGLGTYGMALFFVTPFAMGAACSALHNAKSERTLSSSIAVALLATCLTGLAVLLFAMEGVLCLAMAFPIASVLSSLGALIGWAIMSVSRGKSMAASPPAMLLMGLPLFGAGEAKLAKPELRHVTTTIEVNASPEQVWPNVIGFSELKAPPDWFFKLGVSYPVRAKIHGSGVGAVRHCEFSTGPFVEPITTWDPPRHLAFDVTSQPPSMTELSPYRNINAPHLEGYMTSKGGEFVLTALPGGRTRIEGTTHYTLAIYPEGYWVNFAELLLHAIHKRVLTHIKGLTENAEAE